MTQFILDLFFGFIFVILLIFMAKIKEKAFNENKESYRYAFWGLLVLGIVSVIQLAGHQMLFSGIPFLSEPVYLELASAIGIVAGIALMIAGVSIWLPAKKKQNEINSITSKTAEAIQIIGRAIDETRNADHLFRIMPELLCRNLGRDGAVVLRRLNRKERFVLTNWYNLSDDKRETLTSLTDKMHNPQELIKIIEGEIIAGNHMAVMIKGRVQVLLFLWDNKENTALEFDVKETFPEIERMISKRLEKYYDAVRLAYSEDILHLLTEARNLTMHRSDLKGYLPGLYRLFHRATGAEYFSLAVREKYRHNLRRYIAGINGNILLGGVTSPVFQENYIDYLMETRQSLLVENVSGQTAYQADSLFGSCGQKCLMAVPIIGAGSPIGIITLGHPAPGRLGRREQVRTEFLAAAIAPIIEAEINRHLGQERDRYLGALAAFETAIEKCGDIESLAEVVSETLLRNIGTTFCRITAMSDDRTRLVTQSLKTIRPFRDANTEPVTISRELIPWHHMALSENRPLLINQNDASSRLDGGEAEMLLFKGVQSALIIPIIINGLTYGTITLGEMREWHRFAYDSAAISFSKALATRLANGIKLVQLSRTLLMSGETAIPWQKRPGTEGDIVRRLKEPMTTMQGSIDLLKIRGGDTAGEAGRIMGMLEKSADRVLSILKES